jgi:small subunit ribosomal protein S8
MTTDPVADMLTRIRNAIAVNRMEVSMPYSKLKNTLLQQLLAHGFILAVDIKGEGVHKELVATLQSSSQPARISHLSRISRPGQRVYSNSAKMPKAKSGRGLILVSTSQGVISDREARKKNLGGELICQIY